MKYKGHEYEIEFCNPKEDWREYKGMFYITCAIRDVGFYATYAEAEAKAKDNISEFVTAVPQTKREWLDALTACMVQTGYEDYHLDETMVWELLQKAALHLKPNVAIHGLSGARSAE
jgi:hypothetical protein